MPCPKCSNTLNRCPDGIQSSDCIKFVGESNECLDYCKGQSVSEVVEQIGEEVCTVKTNTDVSEQVIPSCSLPFYQIQGYDEKNVKNFVDFLLKFDCNLQEQINTTNLNLNNFVPIVSNVEWKCVGDFPCNTVNPSVSLNQAIQFLVNALCIQNTTLITQGTEIAQLKSQVTELENKISCLISKLNSMEVILNTEVNNYVVQNFQSCQ